MGSVAELTTHNREGDAAEKARPAKDPIFYPLCFQEMQVLACVREHVHVCLRRKVKRGTEGWQNGRGREGQREEGEGKGDGERKGVREEVT